MVYVGGKYRLAKYICPIIQEIIDKNNISLYIEPFIGGANIFEHIKCDLRVGYDLNNTLIELYKQSVKDFSKIPTDISKEEFDAARAVYKGESAEELEDWYLGAVGFLASFQGKGFWGSYCKSTEKNPYYTRKYNNLKKQVDNLKKYPTEFYQSNYKEIEIPNNSFIYCDPPYENAMPYGYSWERNFNHKEYWDWVREHSNNNFILVSETTLPDDFETLWEKETKTTVSLEKGKKKQEKLGYYKKGKIADYINNK